MAPHQYETEILDASATQAASTEPHTDVAPLMPQNHGIMAGARFAAMPIPMGNAAPITRPMGNSRPTAPRMRRVVSAPSSELMMIPVSGPMPSSTATSASSAMVFARALPTQRPASPLPMPLETSSEKSTTPKP